MRKRLSTTFVFIFIAVLVSSFVLSAAKGSGEPNTVWSRTYGGVNSDGFFSLVATSDGGYAVAGSTGSFGLGIWLVKTDQYGNTEWNKTYGETGVVRFRSLVATLDGGYAIAGTTSSFGAGGYDWWLIKTDKYGNPVWNQTYGGRKSEQLPSLIVASDSGYALAGTTTSFGAGDFDWWLVKTDKYGNMLWNQTYGGTGEDDASSLVLASDGGYVIAGSTGSFARSNEGWLVKTDDHGSTIPEFPSSLIPALFMVATLLAAIVSKIRFSPYRLSRNKQQLTE